MIKKIVIKLIIEIVINVIRQPNVVLIQVPKGTPNTEATLKPEKIQLINQARFSIGAITVANVIDKETRAPDTIATIMREITSIV